MKICLLSIILLLVFNTMIAFELVYSEPPLKYECANTFPDSVKSGEIYNIKVKISIDRTSPDYNPDYNYVLIHPLYTVIDNCIIKNNKSVDFIEFPREFILLKDKGEAELSFIIKITGKHRGKFCVDLHFIPYKESFERTTHYTDRSESYDVRLNKPYDYEFYTYRTDASGKYSRTAIANYELRNWGIGTKNTITVIDRKTNPNVYINEMESQLGLKNIKPIKLDVNPVKTETQSGENRIRIKADNLRDTYELLKSSGYYFDVAGNPISNISTTGNIGTVSLQDTNTIVFLSADRTNAGRISFTQNGSNCYIEIVLH